jgi:uncharacterized protein
MTRLPMPNTCLIVFAKAPVAGAVKTRLIPALGAQGAARLAQRMLQHTLAQALAAQCGAVDLCASPIPDSPAWQGVNVPSGISWSAQSGGDLGQRMGLAFQSGLANSDAVLLMGTDCPALTHSHILQAVQALQTHDAAIIPVADGGYVLLALKQFHPSLFEHMPWSTSAVAAITLERMAALGWSVQQLPALHDIDEPADLQWLPTAWAEADGG